MRIFIKNFFKITRNQMIYDLSKSMLILIWCFIVVKIATVIIKFLRIKAKKMNREADFVLIEVLTTPIKIGIWCLGLYRIVKIFFKKFAFFNELKVLLWASIVVWLCFKFISRYSARVIEIKETKKEKIDYGAIGFFKKISQIIVVSIVVLTGLGKLGISIQSLVAIGGVGGLAIGYAAKDLLANIFGGFSVFWDKPFTVGDWITSPDRDIEGDVVDIGWRKTTILTFEKYPIYVPNSVFSNIIIRNVSRVKSRRIDKIIPIRYIDVNKIQKITEMVKQMLREHPNINKRFTMVVCLESVSVGILNMRVYTYTNTIEWAKFMEIQQDVLFKVADIIHQNGGEIAYDIKEITIKKEQPSNDFGGEIIVDNNMVAQKNTENDNSSSV